VPNGVTLAAGESITLHTGAGTDTQTDLYWDRGGAVWNNGGDMVTVILSVVTIYHHIRLVSRRNGERTYDRNYHD
jgi:hypothetical protein